MRTFEHCRIALEVLPDTNGTLLKCFLGCKAILSIDSSPVDFNHLPTAIGGLP